MANGLDSSCDWSSPESGALSFVIRSEEPECTVIPAWFRRLTETVAMPRNRRNREQKLILDQVQEIDPIIRDHERVKVIGKPLRALIGPRQKQPKRGIDPNLDLPQATLAR